MITYVQVVNVSTTCVYVNNDVHWIHIEYSAIVVGRVLTLTNWMMSMLRHTKSMKCSGALRVATKQLMDLYVCVVDITMCSKSEERGGRP